MQLTRRPGTQHRLPHAARPRRRHVPVGHRPRQRARRDADAARRGRPGRASRPSRPSGPSAARCSSTPRQIRPVGVGELLARRRAPQARCSPPRACSTPSASGRCRSCPARVGLICGRASAAEKDVVENARRRWPAVRFEIREVAVQGADAVTEVIAALQRARPRPGRRRHRHRPRRRVGRGPAAVQQRDPGPRRRRRAAPPSSAPSATTSTPRCSTSSPTWRASTPTDAGQAGGARRRPSSAPRRRQPRDRLRRAVGTRVASERRTWRPCVSRPVMADPAAMIDARRQELDALTDARPPPRRWPRVHRAADQIAAPAARRSRALSPAVHPRARLCRGAAPRRPRGHGPGATSTVGRAAAGAGRPRRLRRAPGRLSPGAEAG